MKKLQRSRRTKVLGGVAAGLAEYFNVDVTLMRLIFAFAGIMMPQVMIPGYIIAWVIIPEEPFIVQSRVEGSGTQGNPGEVQKKGGAEGGLTADEILAQRDAAHGENSSSVNPADEGQKSPPQGESFSPNQNQASATRHEEPTPTRSSQLLGLFIIAIGVILLVPRIVPAFWFSIPSHVIRTFWPILLVGLGLVIVLTAVRRDDR